MATTDSQGESAVRTRCGSRSCMPVRRMFLAGVSVTLASLAALAGPSDGSARNTLINQALDESTKVVLDNIRLADAIETLSDRSGVRIHMPDDVMAMAAYGGDTMINHIALNIMPLRQGLAELLVPLGMTFRVVDGYVAVEVTESLRCLGRAPTWAELDMLSELSRMQPGIDDTQLEVLRARVQFRVPERDAWTTLATAIRDAGAGPGDSALTVACSRLGWSWCVSDRFILVTSATEDVHRRLQKLITVRITYRPLIDVLQAVGQAAGVTIRVEPGALRYLPLRVRQNFSLLVRDVSAEQVLEKLSAETGLGYLIQPGGVLFFATGGAPATHEPSRDKRAGRDPYVGKIIVPLDDGTSIEWLVRRSELPPDLRDRREADLRAAFESLRRDVFRSG